MVCRLCGAANAPQHASCVACGSPLEQAPVARSALSYAQARGARSMWVLLCLALGAGLGLALVHLAVPAPLDRDLRTLAAVLGAVGGGVLGVLPGPAAKHLRAAWADVKAALFTSCAVRRCARIRKRCEHALEAGEGHGEVETRLAACLWLQGTRDRAEQLLRRALQRDESLAVARHNFALAQAAAGRYALAIEEFERARQGLVSSAALYWNMGLARLSQGQLPEAATAFLNVIDLDPYELPPRNALALVRARRGEIEQAQAELEKLLGRRRRNPDVLCNLGVIHQSRGALDVAEQHFAAALQSDPVHVPARYNRALCAMLEGRYQSAIEDFLTVSRIAPTHARAVIQRAVCCYRLGQRERSVEALRRAVRLAPTDFQVRYNAGTLLLREEMIERAVSELEKAYELNPGNIDVIINLGVAMYLTGHLRQAMDHFRAATRMDARHALARYNCAVACSMMDQLDEAEAQIEELVRLYPNFPDAFNAIGVIRMLQGRLVEAAEQFRRVADMMPRSAVARANLALSYYLEGDLSAAREQAGFAVGLDSDLASARDIAGHVALELNERDEAIKQFRALARLEPSSPDAHSNLGLSHYKDDRLAEAIEAYKRVLIFSPKSPEGHNDLGLAYAKDKRLEEAAQHLAQVLEWRPGSPVLHSNLGLVYYFKGDTEEAVNEWREVTRLSPRYARMREATRFSAYDDQEMNARPVDRKARAMHLPLKIAAFRHSFQLAFDESGYRLEIPWPDIANCARWQERATAAHTAARRP